MSRRRSSSRMASSAGGIVVDAGTAWRAGVDVAGEVAHPATAPIRPRASAARRLTILGSALFLAPRPTPRVLHGRLDRGRNDGLDPAANVEVTRYLHPPCSTRGGEVVEDPVHRALIEDPVVAKAPEIELEALELEAEP